MKKIITSTFIILSLSVQLFAQVFTNGNLIVCQVGDGSTVLTSASAPVQLIEYTPGGTLVQTVSLPVSPAGSNLAITCAGSSTSEGLITRSQDGRSILLAGYNAPVATAAIALTTGAAVNRVVAKLGSDGSVDITTALPDFSSGGNPRSVASTDGNNLWVCGSMGGVRYTTLGATSSTQISTSYTNIRQANIFDGQLYVSSGSSTMRLATVGTGIPNTAGQTITELPGIPLTGSPYGFFFADLDAGVPGVDVVYVADDVSGIIKYSLVGGSWVNNDTVATAARGLTGFVNGSTVTLYATTSAAGASPNSIVTLTDASGYNGFFTGTASTIATALTNYAFRGIAPAPILGLGVNNIIDDNEFNIFPNPADNSLKLIAKQNGKFHVEIVSMLGEIVSAFNSDQNQTEIDISKLSTGIYFVNLISANNSQRLKFIKN